MRVLSDLTAGEISYIEQAWKSGIPGSELDRRYNLTPGSVRKHAYRHQWRTGSVMERATRGDFVDGGPVEPVKRTWDQDVEVERLQSEINHLRRQYKQALKEKVAIDRLVEVAEDAIRAAEPVVPYDLDFSINDSDDSFSSGEHQAVALLGDLHVGEVVSAKEMNNLSEYNLEIFHQRMEIWTEKVLSLVELRRDRLYLPNLSIFLLGDIVSGDIHDELSNTNEVGIVDQTVQAAHGLSRALLTLAPHFDTIEVSGVAGNHGRMRRKPYFKNKQRNNFDYLIYQMLAMILVKQENIKFHIPESFWTVRDVLGTRFLMMHGDGIKGWAGIPFYGVQRAYLKLLDLIGRDIPFDKVVMGHFHDPVETERFIINGAMKGGDDFSVGALYASNRPSQTLLYVHERNGVVGTEKIYLDDHQDRQVKLSEGVWHFEK